ncbi:MAG TPA: LysE family translocator [Burkholderiaceae bacterium]
MQQIDQLGSFLIAVLVFQLVPGPGTLSILRATADHGHRAGFAAVAGTLLGGLLCMLAAASGLEALFRGHAEATQALQWGGAGYLAWMGWRLMRPPAGGGAVRDVVAPPLARHVSRALAVSLTNPKVILFYFALLPLFFRPPVTSNALLTMACCVTGISLVYQSALVLVGNVLARRLGAVPWARQVMQRLAGLAFIGFALKLFVV